MPASRTRIATDCGDSETVAKLHEAIPVYLAYFTARVTPDDIVQFRDDIYGIDQRQSAKLASAVTAMKDRAAAAADVAF